MQREADLLHVTPAFCQARRLARVVNRRQQDRDQQYYDRDDDEQFGAREGHRNPPFISRPSQKSGTVSPAETEIRARRMSAEMSAERNAVLPSTKPTCMPSP